jgi:hypothetical protein
MGKYRYQAIYHEVATGEDIAAAKSGVESDELNKKISLVLAGAEAGEFNLKQILIAPAPVVAAAVAAPAGSKK